MVATRCTISSPGEQAFLAQRTQVRVHGVPDSRGLRTDLYTDLPLDRVDLGRTSYIGDQLTRPSPRSTRSRTCDRPPRITCCEVHTRLWSWGLSRTRVRPG